jgi:hypothetical protein
VVSLVTQSVKHWRRAGMDLFPLGLLSVTSAPRREVPANDRCYSRVGDRKASGGVGVPPTSSLIVDVAGNSLLGSGARLVRRGGFASGVLSGNNVVVGGGG